ncbi:MAG: PQQ-binding-like beta-propeller repeat protein, partial [Gemmataceae bacterium]
PEKTPAGMIVAVDSAKGTIVWERLLAKSVHTRLAVDAARVYAAGMEGVVLALDRHTGKEVWRQPVGERFHCGPVLSRSGQRLFAVNSAGRAVCLDTATGKVLWHRALAELTGKTVSVTSEVVHHESTSGDHELFIAVGLTNSNNGAASAAIIRLKEPGVTP